MLKSFKTTFLILVLSFTSIYSFSDVYMPFQTYVSPGLKLGFNITSRGLYIGPTIDIGLWRNYWGNPTTVNAGLNIEKTWTWVNNYGNKSVHKQRSIGVMVETPNLDLKFGYTSIRNGWGFNNVNECRVGGVYIDGSYTKSTYDFPWFGVNAVFYKRANWGWFDRPYVSLYTKYKYDFKKSELKDF